MTNLQRIWRRMNFLLRVARSRLKRVSRPLYVGLAVTSRCNLRCSFCYGLYYNNELPDLPLDDLMGLLRHLGQRGTAYINIAGGEPLIRDDIGAIIRSSLDQGMITSLTTNGTLIDHFIDDLTLLDFVCVSVDGDEFGHDRVRGVGTHKKILRNIRLLRERNVPVQVTSLMNRYNQENMRWIFEAGRELGFTVKLHIPNEETVNGPNNPDIAITDEEIRNMLKNVIQWQREGLPVDFSSTTYDYALKWPRSHWQPIIYRGEKFPAPPWPCYSGQFWCQIDADGKVYPCCAMFKNFDGLDFREVGFEEAFAHIQTRNCVTCAYLSNNEFNQLISLRPRVLIENAWRSIRLLGKEKRDKLSAGSNGSFHR